MKYNDLQHVTKSLNYPDAKMFYKTPATSSDSTGDIPEDIYLHYSQDDE